jgi:predicted RNA-binding Zn-ribbon protein involved in translation (DUF1610 family)
MPFGDLCSFRKMALPSRYPFNKYTCTQCGWSTILIEKGDVILGAEKCKQCGSDNFTRAKASQAESMLAHPIEFIKHIAR